MQRKIFAFVMLAIMFVSVAPIHASLSKKDQALLEGVLGNVLNEAKKSSSNSKSNSNTKQKTKAETPASLTGQIQKNEEAKELSPAQYEKLESLGYRVMSDLEDLGNKIISYNKPAAEFKLTKNERLFDEYGDGNVTLSETMYSRVWVKGKTIVIGSAGKDKKFILDSIVTGEPDFPPAVNNSSTAPRIYAGQNINVIEKFMGLSADNMAKILSYKPGYISCSPENFQIVNLFYKDGKITQTQYSNGYSLIPERVQDFESKKAKELGLILESDLSDGSEL